MSKTDSRTAFLKQLGPLPRPIFDLNTGTHIPTDDEIVQRVNRSIGTTKERKILPKIKIRDKKQKLRILNSEEFRLHMVKMADIFNIINEMDLESFIVTCQKYEQIQGIRDESIWSNFAGLMQQWSEFAAALRSAGVEYKEFQRSRTI